MEARRVKTEEWIQNHISYLKGKAAIMKNLPDEADQYEYKLVKRRITSWRNRLKKIQHFKDSQIKIF